MDVLAIPEDILELDLEFTEFIDFLKTGWGIVVES